MKPEGWFERGYCLKGGSTNPDGIWIPEHEDGVFLWEPAPAGAAFAIKQNREARHKQTDIAHIFVTPKILSRSG